MTCQGPDDLVAGPRYERVEEGRYTILVEKAERGPGWTDRRTGQPKKMLYLRCRILSGPFKGTQLFMPLNITFKHGHPPPSSVFYEAWTVAMDRKPGRREPMKLQAFQGKVFEAEVVTVIRDGKGRIRSSVTHYSRVSRLLQLLGTKDAYFRPQTEYRIPDTEYPTPPSPGDFKENWKGYEEEAIVTSGGQAGRQAVGFQKQESQPGGGPTDPAAEPALDVPSRRWLKTNTWEETRP